MKQNGDSKEPLPAANSSSSSFGLRTLFLIVAACSLFLALLRVLPVVTVASAPAPFFALVVTREMLSTKRCDWRNAIRSGVLYTTGAGFTFSIAWGMVLIAVGHWRWRPLGIQGFAYELGVMLVLAVVGAGWSLLLTVTISLLISPFLWVVSRRRLA